MNVQLIVTPDFQKVRTVKHQSTDLEVPDSISVGGNLSNHKRIKFDGHSLSLTPSCHPDTT